MNYGFIKVAAITPNITVADPSANALAVSAAIRRTAEAGARIVVLPELVLTGYTCGDLFGQSVLTDSARTALSSVVADTAGLDLIAIVGLPLRHGGNLYNVAAVIGHGNVYGFVPKQTIPNYGEFDEGRYFRSGYNLSATVQFNGQDVPLSANQLFQCSEMPELRLGVEIGADLWTPVPPSSYMALNQGTLIANISACAEIAGKADKRRALVTGQSARTRCGYVYAEAGSGESTTDLVFAAHNLIAENGKLLAEAKPFGDGFVISEIDVNALTLERLRMNTFATNPWDDDYAIVPFSLTPRRTRLTRIVNPNPFIPDDPKTLAERCETMLAIQSAGLGKRLTHVHAKSLVLGVSGGLDSTLALLVAARTLQQLNRPMSDILAVTMPGYGTTSRTKSNAVKLSEALGATLREIPIGPAVAQHFTDLGHDPSDTSVLFENAQARERTQILMDLCHQVNGIVVGTGDLSELALGWATYNGDHMSMYGVNGGVPKTLVRVLVRYVATQTENQALKEVLFDILDTPVSPELIPSAGETMTQLTESILGSYNLHDFFLDQIVRHGFTPRKTFYLAKIAYRDVFTAAEIRTTLTTFLKRFFNNQFKRSCFPDGPKVVPVSLSPRGNWRMPSDALVTVWLDDLNSAPDDETEDDKTGSPQGGPRS